MYEIPILLRFVATTLGLSLAAWTSASVSTSNPGIFFLTVVILTVLNLLLKPALVLLVLPFVVFTLGLGLWVVNALLIMLAAQVIPGFVLTGWGGAFWSALWISVFTLFFIFLTGKSRTQYQNISRNGEGFRKQRKADDDDDVIDI